MKILAYHSVRDGFDSQFILNIDEFLKQIEFFKKKGFNFVNLNKGINFNKNDVLITFDDGYKDNYEVFKLLKKQNISFSVFLATKYIGKTHKLGGIELPMLNEGEIKEMYESGLVYFGNHTHSHLILNKIDDYNLVKNDITKANKIIKDMLGYNPKYFVYPKGRKNEKFDSIIKELFEFAFRGSGCVKKVDNYNIPRIEIFHNTPWYKVLYNFYCLHWLRKFV